MDGMGYIHHHSYHHERNYCSQASSSNASSVVAGLPVQRPQERSVSKLKRLQLEKKHMLDFITISEPNNTLQHVVIVVDRNQTPPSRFRAVTCFAGLVNMVACDCTPSKCGVEDLGLRYASAVRNSTKAYWKNIWWFPQKCPTVLIEKHTENHVGLTTAAFLASEFECHTMKMPPPFPAAWREWHLTLETFFL